MQWDGLTLKAFAGIAAGIASGALLSAGVGLVVPMMGLVAGRRRDAGGQSRPAQAACGGSRKDASGRGQRKGRRGSRGG
jgi:hypothetical protein